jgi:RimJ/RimL family protein N-acetyltransferase
VTEREVDLRDGSRAIVRPIRPSDRDGIRDAFSRLSEESRYRRFLTSIESLSERELTYLTDVDHHDHEALIAFDPETGRGLGAARFVRNPEEPDMAEAAVAVVDEAQGRGLGTCLTLLLAERAREEGIGRFTATLLADNQPMIGLLDAIGRPHIVSRDGATMTVEVDVPGEGIGASMRQLLRTTAQGIANLARLPGRGN